MTRSCVRFQSEPRLCSGKWRWIFASYWAHVLTFIIICFFFFLYRVRHWEINKNKMTRAVPSLVAADQHQNEASEKSSRRSTWHDRENGPSRTIDSTVSLFLHARPGTWLCNMDASTVKHAHLGLPLFFSSKSTKKINQQEPLFEDVKMNQDFFLWMNVLCREVGWNREW